jgi:hypothetical protein
MKKRIEKIKKLLLVGTAFLMYPFIAIQNVYAQSDPSGEISAIIERIVTLATRIGSGILILFIIKDGIEFVQNSETGQSRNIILRDVFLLIIAAVFLFKPDFILDAIKFIANV